MPALANLPGETLGDILGCDNRYCDWGFDTDVMSYDKLNKFLVFREGCEERNQNDLVDRFRKATFMIRWKNAFYTSLLEEHHAALNRAIGVRVFGGPGWTHG